MAKTTKVMEMPKRIEAAMSVRKWLANEASKQALRRILAEPPYRPPAA